MGVLARLNTLLRDTNANLEDASLLIKSDGSLAATIIKISNSAYYGSQDKSKDVLSALRKVGLNEALRLVGIAISKQVFMRDLNAYGISADDFWSYSYFSAVHMETAARRLGLDADDAYLLGLLHAVGRVVINELLRETQVEVFWDMTLPSEMWEDVMVGFRHHVAGAELLKRWAFADSITQSIENQFEESYLRNDMMVSLLGYTRQYADQHCLDLYACEQPPEGHPYQELSKSDQDQLEFDINHSIKTVKAVHDTLKDA